MHLKTGTTVNKTIFFTAQSLAIWALITVNQCGHKQSMANDNGPSITSIYSAMPVEDSGRMINAFHNQVTVIEQDSLVVYQIAVTRTESDPATRDLPVEQQEFSKVDTLYRYLVFVGNNKKGFQFDSTVLQPYILDRDSVISSTTMTSFDQALAKAKVKHVEARRFVHEDSLVVVYYPKTKIESSSDTMRLYYVRGKQIGDFRFSRLLDTIPNMRFCKIEFENNAREGDYKDLINRRRLLYFKVYPGGDARPEEWREVIEKMRVIIKK